LFTHFPSKPKLKSPHPSHPNDWIVHILKKVITGIMTRSYVESKIKLQTIKKVIKSEKGLEKLFAIALGFLGQNCLLPVSL